MCPLTCVIHGGVSRTSACHAKGILLNSLAWWNHFYENVEQPSEVPFSGENTVDFYYVSQT